MCPRPKGQTFRKRRHKPRLIPDCSALIKAEQTDQQHRHYNQKHDMSGTEPVQSPHLTALFRIAHWGTRFHPGPRRVWLGRGFQHPRLDFIFA